MNRYRLNRDQYTPNNLGSLYVDNNIEEAVIKKGFNPVIYIGGQMEHRLHRLENWTGITADVGHRIFNGSWFYEYSNKGTKSNINAINFADNLIKALELAGLYDVDIITESYGGLVAALASQSPRVRSVVTIHTPILGTPLADREMLLDALSMLEKRNRMTARIVSLVVNDCFGFEQDNAKGIISDPRLLNLIDLDKLTVIGSNMDRKKDKSWIACALYDVIYELTGKESDGVVLFDKAEFDRYGIKYIEERYPTNHFDAGSKSNLMRAAAMTLDGFDFPEGDCKLLESPYYDDGTEFKNDFYDNDLHIMTTEELFADEDRAKSKEIGLDHVSSERALKLNYFNQKKEQERKNA